MVYIGYGFCNAGGCSRFNGSHEDDIAVVIICDDKIIVSLVGRLWQASCLIGVHHLFWFCGGQKAGVGSVVVVRWGWEEIVVGIVGVGGGFCAARVFALGV